MSLYTISGSKFYIGGVKATGAVDWVASDFTGISPDLFVLVDGWVNAGAFGDNAQVITTALINRGRDVKQKGTTNAGSMQNQFAVIQGDAGQAACVAAVATSNEYAMKITFTDGTSHYFTGMIMSVQEQGGGANTARIMKVQVEINSNIVIV